MSAFPRRRYKASSTAPALRSFTWFYIAWSLLPVLVAIRISFNGGKSRSSLQPMSMRWYTGDRKFVKEDVDIAIHPTNPNIVYVGTGEPNNRQTSSFGDGIYKTTDGGKTFTNMGLKEVQSIARIVIDPRNPNTVYAMLWSQQQSFIEGQGFGNAGRDHRQRGVFRRGDGAERGHDAPNRAEQTDERRDRADRGKEVETAGKRVGFRHHRAIQGCVEALARAFAIGNTGLAPRS